MTDADGQPVEVNISRFKVCYEGKLIPADMPEEHSRNLLAALVYYMEVYMTILPQVFFTVFSLNACFSFILIVVFDCTYVMFLLTAPR